MGGVELVLHVKQPVTNPRSNDHYRKIGRHDREKSERSASKTEGHEQREIERKDAAARVRVSERVT